MGGAHGPKRVNMKMHLVSVARGPKRVNMKMHLVGVARWMPITWGLCKVVGAGLTAHRSNENSMDNGELSRPCPCGISQLSETPSQTS